MTQNFISSLYHQATDLSSRWKSILDSLTDVPFKPDDQPTSFVKWFNTEKVGSVQIHGTYQHQPAILKIQGVKPDISEIEHTQQFSKQTRSTQIRAPQILYNQPWDETQQAEIIIWEKTTAPSLHLSKPIKPNELSNYLQVYQDFQTNAITNPWIPKPDSISFQKKFNQITSVTKSTKDLDQNLIQTALDILKSNITPEDLVFQHGHFEPSRIRQISENQYIIISHLFWGWKNPFYDLVFGYHWHMLGMESIPNLTQQILDTERTHWLDSFYNLNQVSTTPQAEKWLTLARLERALFAYAADSTMLDKSKPSYELIKQDCYNQLHQLIDQHDSSK